MTPTGLLSYRDKLEINVIHGERFTTILSRQQITKSLRIYHECEGRIGISVPRITILNHEACRVMTSGDPEGRIFLSYSHPNNGFFFLLTIRKGSEKFLNTLSCDML